MGPLLASDSTVWVPAECEVLAALSAVQTDWPVVKEWDVLRRDK